MDTAYKWGTCSQELSYAVSLHRHVVPRGGLTTLCGATASDPSIWRDQKAKPNCSVCVTRADALDAARETPAPALHDNGTENTDGNR